MADTINRILINDSSNFNTIAPSMDKTKEEQLIGMLSKTNWRHKIKLGPNIYTPGYCAEYEWDLCLLPNNFKNQTFLDVASNDGMYSYLAEKKGASKVTGFDIYSNVETLEMTQSWDIEKPLMIKKYFDLQAEFISMDVMNLGSLEGKFDYVFCSNLLAWLADPLGALKSIAAKAGNILHLREDVSPLKGKPALEFVYKKAGNCYYNPNKAFFIETLTQLGFSKIEFSLVDEREQLLKRLAEQILVVTDIGVPIYLNPFTKEVVSKTTTDHLQLSYLEYKDHFFIEKAGWVRKSDVKATQPLMLGRSYPYLTSLNKILNNKLKLERNHIIIASR